MSLAHVFLGVLAAAIWGTNFAAMKLSYQTFTPLSLLFFRFFLCTFPFLFFVPRPKLSWKVLGGIVSFAWVGHFVPTFIAVYLGMPGGLCSLVMQAQVIFTTVLSIFLFQTHLSKVSFLGLCLSGLGIVAIALCSEQEGIFWGYVLVLLGAFSNSLGNIFLKKAAHENIVSLLVWGSFWALWPLAGLAMVIEGHDALWRSLQSMTVASGSGLIYTAYLSSFFAYYLWAFLMRHHSPATVVPFSMLVPIFGLSSCAFFWNERMGVAEILASLCVMLGLVVNHLGKGQKGFRFWRSPPN
jgi:O-acetylserine/cysteine efflux transporter